MAMGDGRNGGGSGFRLWWLIPILVSWLSKSDSRAASPGNRTGALEDAGVVRSNSSTDADEGGGVDKRHALALIRDDLKWWFPSSLAVASASAILLVYISQRYYSSFYLAFGLDPVQAGVTQADTLFRILPIVILLGLACFIARVLFLANRADLRKSRDQNAKRGRWWPRLAPILVPLLCSGLFAGVVGWAGSAQDAGREDAQQVIASRYNYVYSSLWQQMLGTKTLVVTLGWTGAPESSVLPSGQLDEAGKPYTIARIVSQSGVNTVYFDLLDCTVHAVPTAQVSLSYGPTRTGSAPAEQIDEIDGCRAPDD